MRQQYHWDVPVQSQDGDTHMERVSAYWSPDKIEVREQYVPETARVQAIWRAASVGKKIGYAVIGDAVPA